MTDRADNRSGAMRLYTRVFGGQTGRIPLMAGTWLPVPERIAGRRGGISSPPARTDASD